MFECDDCEKFTAEYKGEGVFKCVECGSVRVTAPRVRNCVYCGATYTEYTWFDPSGCNKCCRSFVD